MGCPHFVFVACDVGSLPILRPVVDDVNMRPDVHVMFDVGLVPAMMDMTGGSYPDVRATIVNLRSEDMVSIPLSISPDGTFYLQWIKNTQRIHDVDVGRGIVIGSLIGMTRLHPNVKVFGDVSPSYKEMGPPVKDLFPSCELLSFGGCDAGPQFKSVDADGLLRCLVGS